MLSLVLSGTKAFCLTSSYIIFKEPYSLNFFRFPPKFLKTSPSLILDGGDIKEILWA